MRGLVNLGNTCYFNTAVQGLLYTPVLTNRFLIHGYDGDCAFTKAYHNLVKEVWLSPNKTPIQPVELLHELRRRYSQFRGAQPNDVQEVVLCIIDVFEKSLGLEWIQKHFYGKTKTVVTWPEGSSDTSDVFACKMLENSEDFFSKTTTISGYKDTSDKVWDEADVCVSTESIGTVFMVSFNMYQSKQNVTLPKQFEFQGKHYKIYCAAMHLGSHLGGHYAAVVCHKDKWYIKDDDMITDVDDLHETGPYYFCMYKKFTPPSQQPSHSEPPQ